MALALGVGTTATAFAHAPPQATDIRWLGERAIIRTNRGLVVEDRASSSFRLLCNDAYRASLAEVVPFELTADGRILLATYDAGIVVSSPDQCSFDAATGPFAGFIVLDVAGDPQGNFHATVYPLDDSTPALLKSDDGGRTFRYQTDLTGVPTSVRVAPSDPTRVYVTVTVPDGNAVAAKLETSSDAGERFRETPIELEASELGAVVLGVHPRDADRAFVRTQSRDGVSPERLLVTNAETGTLETALTAPGPLSLASGANGILWAGSAQGLYRFIDADGRFAPASSYDVSRIGCVATREDRLYVCGFSAGEFGVLVSDDEGASFDWFLRFPEVGARLDCSATSHEGASCESAFLDWSVEQGLISPEGGAAGDPSVAAASGGGASGGQASSHAGGSSGAGTPGDAGGVNGGVAGSTSGSVVRPPPAAGGCALALTQRTPKDEPRAVASMVVACFVLLARRRRER